MFVDRNTFERVMNAFVGDRQKSPNQSCFWNNVHHFVHNIETSCYLRAAVAHLPQQQIVSDYARSTSICDWRLYRLLASHPSGFGIVVSDYTIEEDCDSHNAMATLAVLCMNFACPGLVTARRDQTSAIDALVTRDTRPFVTAVPQSVGPRLTIIPSFDIAYHIAEAYNRHCISGFSDAMLPQTFEASDDDSGEYNALNNILLLSELVRTIATIVRHRLKDPSSALEAVDKLLRKLTSEEVYLRSQWQYRYFPLRHCESIYRSSACDKIVLSLSVTLRTMSESKALSGGMLTVEPSLFRFERNERCIPLSTK
jgi:hypothetical protein